MMKALAANRSREPAGSADPVVAGGPASLDVVRLVRAEYLEMPGLGLTIPQVARFFTLTVEESQRTLARLVDEGLLVCDANGAYRRCR